MTSDRNAVTRRGFTLIELLVVIGIIMLLLAILLPVVSQVRVRAYDTSTQSEMSRIMTACQMYYHDYNAYPGPIANSYLSGGTNAGNDPSPAKLVAPAGSTGNAITSSENLLLGLFGYLTPPTTLGTPPTVTVPNPPAAPPWTAPTHDVLSLNPLHPASNHYMDFIAEEVSPGPASGIDFYAGQSPTDTQFPEFVDHFPEHMPIIYIRANAGNPGIASPDDTTQYNWMELKDYGSYLRMADGTAPWAFFTQANVQAMYTAGTSMLLADDVAQPYQDFVGATGNYFLNPNIAGTAKGKNGFLLIGAGIDHVYGTADDTIISP